MPTPKTAPATVKPRGRPATHGLTALKQVVRARGSRAIDGRTTVGRALAAWRAQLIADLGGNDSLSTQEAALVDLAVRTKLLLDSVDDWLLQQHSLVNARKRTLLPVVRERTQLADALARYLAMLGLKRRPKRVPSLEDYLASRYTDDIQPDDARCDGPAPAADSSGATSPEPSPHDSPHLVGTPDDPPVDD